MKKRKKANSMQTHNFASILRTMHGRQKNHDTDFVARIGGNNRLPHKTNKLIYRIKILLRYSYWISDEL